MGNIFNKFFMLLQRTKRFTDDEIIIKLKEWSSLSRREQLELEDFLLLRFEKFLSFSYIQKYGDLKGFWKKPDADRLRDVYFKTIIAFKKNIQEGRFREDSNLNTYFKGIFWYKSNDIYKKRDTIIPSSGIDDLSDSEQREVEKRCIDPSVDFSDSISRALEILKKENPCYANLIQFKFIEGKSYEEIAKLDTCCQTTLEKTLKNKMGAARKRFEAIIENLD